MSFKIFLYNNKIFWLSRRLFLYLSFLLRKLLFLFREKVREGNQSTSIVLTLITNVWQVGLASIVAVTVLELSEYAYHQYFLVNYNLLPTWFVRVNVYVRDFIQLDKESIRHFLGTVAGVAGVFLGLYFAAISVIAGSLFPNVAGVIREQLVREKAGNLYVKQLALLTSISILLLGYMSIGRIPGILNILFVILLSLFSVLSFILLGRRVFNFFDYYELASSVFADLYTDIRHSTIEGFAWNKENFQAHYQKNASKHLECLRIFIHNTLLTKEKEEEPLVKISHGLIYLLTIYQKEKRHIPTDSKWYKAVPKYQNWFLADSTSLTIALNSDVSIMPKNKSNMYWFEDEVCSNLRLALTDVFMSGRIQTGYRIIQPFGETLKSCGEELAFEEADRIIILLRDQILSYTYKLDKVVANHMSSNDHNLGLVDYYGYCILNYCLGFIKTLSENSSQLFLNKLERIAWQNRKSIYKQDFPCSMLFRLEFVQRTCLFEDRVEGKIVSPRWYRNQLIVMQYLNLISSGLLKIVELLKTEFIEVSTAYLERDQIVFSALHANRGIEICNKLHFLISKDRSTIDSFKNTRILNELPWPMLDFDNLYNDIQIKREHLIGIISQCLPKLSLIDRPAEVPDIFGQSYNTVYSHLMLLLEQNKVEESDKLFQNIFFAAIRAYGRLQKEKEIMEADSTSKVLFGSEPIIDIIDLSGYIKIYSELYFKPKIWDICENTWSQYLDARSNNPNVLEYIINIYQYHKSIIAILPRDELRTNWRIQLSDILQRDNLVDDYGRGGYYDDNLPLEHRSPLIRALCYNRHKPLISSGEVFIFSYLLKRPEANGIPFKDNHNFVEKLFKETLRQSNNKVRGKKK